VARPLVTDVPSLDVLQAREAGLFTPGASLRLEVATTDADGCLPIVGKFTIASTADALTFTDELDGGGDATVPVVRQPMRFGGIRYRFRCPARSCDRRVEMLYLVDGYFACRVCHHLAYRSQRESSRERLLTKAVGIRRRLGWPDDPMEPNGDRPKRMRSVTFDRLRAQHDALLAEALTSE